MEQAVLSKSNLLPRNLSGIGWSEMGVPIAVVAIVIALIMPIPGALLDFLIVVDI